MSAFNAFSGHIYLPLLSATEDDWILGKDGKYYRLVPTIGDSKEKVDRFIDWQRNGFYKGQAGP